ncbi:MAG: hypothetical protein IJZ35_03125 [Clostridia bacterium]|nr:hypothetical protein [Clostridia bacterium]
MKLSSNKKLLITVGVFAVIIIASAVVLKLVGSMEKDDNTSIYNDETVSVEYNSDDYIQEYTTKEVTTVSEMNNSSITLEEIAIMNAYIDGQYYLSGVMNMDGTPTEIDLAISGKNFQTSMEVEGMDMSIMYLNGNVYFVDNSTKIYLALTDLLMDSMDVDLSEMEEITEYLSLEAYNFTSFKEGKTEIDGVTANCYTYYNDEMSVAFCFIDNELRQVNYGDGYGNVASSMTVYEFSSQIPSGMLTLSGLRGTTAAAFLNSYMDLLG